MATDTLAPYINWLSAATIFTMQIKWVIVDHKEFWLPQCQESIENANIFISTCAKGLDFDSQHLPIVYIENLELS